MKKIAQYFLLLPVVCISFSCKKEGKIDGKILEGEGIYSNYMPLKAGNYWVYEVFEVDSNDVESIHPDLDSTYVVPCRKIRNNQYYCQSSKFPVYNFIRDSSDYLIDSLGRVLFCAKDFNTIFGDNYITNQFAGDTIFRSIYKMDDKDLSLTTPAGNFVTITAKTTTTFYPHYTRAGLRNPKISVSRYARNVGIVYEKLEYNSINAYLGRRLKRYHVQ